MKKTVRIRKALPGEQPGYYNKTAKFLKKAQMGMAVESVSRDPQRMNLIYQNVYGSLKQSMTPDIVYNELVTEYALDQQTSLNIIKTALNQLAQEGYVDPELMDQTQQQQQEGDPNAAQDQQQANEDQQRASDDAEQEELAMSDEGYYDEEEALNNDTSHLETEQDEQEQAFRFGGYRRQEGGEADEYSDYQDAPNQSQSGEDAAISQYDNPGQNKMEKPFSIEDLMAVTPGMQGQEAFPDLSYYLGDYRPISDSYQPMDYLPTAQRGGQLPKAQDGLNFLQRFTQPISRGLNFTREISPLTNLSGIRKSVPVFSAIGEGMTRLPLIGSKFTPKLETTFTQNRTELWNVLNGAAPKNGIFSQSGTYAGGADGSLSADRLMLYQDDVKNIIQNIQTGRSAFTLADIGPKAEYDGLVSGVYPMDAKVISGTDDNGFQFFELKHTFGPNQRLPFGTTPAKAKEVTVKNRFYFNTDATTGEVNVFDQLGNPLSTGAKTKYDITRPLGTTFSRMGKYLTTDAGLLETNTYDKSLTGYEYGFPSKSGDGTWMSRDETAPIYDDEGNIINNEITTSYFDVDRDPQYSITGQFGTPYPNYMDGLYPTGKGFLGNNMGRLREVSDIAPATLDRLSRKGKFGRGLENFAMSTWVPQLVGLGNPIRTSSANVKEMSLPVYGYRNAALGPDVIDPAKEGSYGSDIRNAINYKYRLGLKTTLIGGGLGYLGYQTYDALVNKCQCTNPLEPNYMKPDAFKRCPCGTDVGPSRTLDPTAIPNTELNTPRAMPDSMMFLIERGLEPNAENYWRYRDSLNLDKSKRAFGDDFAKGGITKNQFVKKFTAKFQEGGDAKNPTLGQGKRTDNLTEDVANKKDIFRSKLKDNSNIALTQEIYKNAQSNPQILNMLMQDGPKENLAEDQGMPMAQYGGFTDDSVPSWYTGYKGMRAPKEYRKMFRQMSKMMPRGNDISRANLASNMYDRRTMQPPFGGVMTYPDYMNMLLTSQMSNIALGQMAGNPLANWASSVDRNTPVYGGPMTGGPSSQAQADAATMQNIMKNIPLLPSMTPDFIDSPLRTTGYKVPASTDAIEDYFANKRTPIVGETWDTWYTSDGSTPGFAPDTRTWDGTQWVGPTPTERMQLENHEQGGFVDMDSKNPLVKFIYGGDEAEYYEPYGLPMAQDGGINILNHAGEHRVVANSLPFDEWAEGEKEDFATTHPGQDFDTWKADAASQGDFLKYKDFYNESLGEYLDYGKKDPAPNNQTNGNCPAGYKWDGTKCVLIQNNTNTQTKCGPGTVWNATYKACIPVAQVNYNPRVVRGQSGFFNNVLPWNPIAGYAGSWTKQKSLPYYLGNKNPYMGQLPGTPAARYVTKKGILGRPKKWIDIYQTSGNNPIDPLQLEQLMKQKNSKPQREKQERERKQEGPHEVRGVNWNAVKYRMNPKNWGGREKKPKQKQYGGPYMQMGGNPFELGSGLSTNVGQNKAWYEHSTATVPTNNSAFSGQREVDFVSNNEGMVPNIQPSSFWNDQQSFQSPPPAAPASMQQQNQQIEQYTTDPNQIGSHLAKKEVVPNEYVGVENKRKDMRSIDPEAGVNVFNAGARGVLGVLDRRQNAKSEREMLLNTVDPMNLYASANEQDRGDWQDFGSKSGMFRYDQEGQDRSSRATYGQYGGYMQEGGQSFDPSQLEELIKKHNEKKKSKRTMQIGYSNPPTYMVYDENGKLIFSSKNEAEAKKVLNSGESTPQNFQYGGSFEQDEEVYMSPEELEQFLAAGGQVEYL